jgi:hypothetical protein
MPRGEAATPEPDRRDPNAQFAAQTPTGSTIAARRPILGGAEGPAVPATSRLADIPGFANTDLRVEGVLSDVQPLRVEP